MFEITNVKLKKLENSGKMKAVGSITINSVFVVKDVKVVESDTGLFVAMPSKKVDDKYMDVAHPITTEARTVINDAVLEAYKSLE